MSTKGGLIFLITSIILVLCCIVGLIGVYYFDWLKPANSGYTLYTTTSDNDARFVIKDDEPLQQYSQNVAVTSSTVAQPSDVRTAQTAPADSETVTTVVTSVSAGNPQIKYTYLNPKEEVSHSESSSKNELPNQNAITEQKASENTVNKTDTPSVQSTPVKVATTEKAVTPTVSTPAKPAKPASPARTSSGNPVRPNPKMPAPRFTKAESVPEVKSVPVGKDGSPIKIGFTFDKNRDFHSYGQYVSADEYKYRLAVINNLKIKTIIIDAVSDGNGISQEYYKVAYNANMIPAKILDDIVTSKEFRALIPKQYLNIEEKMTKFPKGGKVTFSNTDMKNLLILWSQGKLTPAQKAWQVKATM